MNSLNNEPPMNLIIFYGFKWKDIGTIPRPIESPRPLCGASLGWALDSEERRAYEAVFIPVLRFLGPDEVERPP